MREVKTLMMLIGSNMCSSGSKLTCGMDTFRTSAKEASGRGRGEKKGTYIIEHGVRVIRSSEKEALGLGINNGANGHTEAASRRRQRPPINGIQEDAAVVERVCRCPTTLDYMGQNDGKYAEARAVRV